MTKTSKSKIFALTRKDPLSTLELWQAHLQALKRASREQHNLTKGGKPIQTAEITTSEISIRPRQ